MKGEGLGSGNAWVLGGRFGWKCIGLGWFWCWKGEIWWSKTHFGTPKRRSLEHKTIQKIGKVAKHFGTIMIIFGDHFGTPFSGTGKECGG